MMLLTQAAFLRKYDRGKVHQLGEAKNMKLPKTWTFRGIANRTEMWTVYGVCLLIFSIANLIDTLIFGNREDPGMFGMLAALIVVWPLWTTQVRRWHDRGKSGLWCFINLVPVIGGLWSFIELGCLPSKGTDLLGERNPYREDYSGI